MVDMLNSRHFCLERPDSIENTCQTSGIQEQQTQKQRTLRAGHTEPFLKKVISQWRTHLRDTKTKSNATEISLFSQQIQLATLSIFLAYISLALPISCNLFVMHFETFVAPQNMQLTGTSNQKLYHINCKTLGSTSHGLTRPIFSQIDFCEINFRGFCEVFWGFFANP